MAQVEIISAKKQKQTEKLEFTSVFSAYICVTHVANVEILMKVNTQFTNVCIWDIKFGIRIGSDLPQMGHIRDFFRSDSVHFGATRQNVLKLILKSPRFDPFADNLSQSWSKYKRREYDVINVKPIRSTKMAVKLRLLASIL